MEFTGKILLTGGSGTLGKAFMQKAKDEGWDCQITVFSRDWTKHRLLRKDHPEVTFIVGDVLSIDALRLAMVGHDIVIHMAAMKHVVEGEKYPLSVFETNVIGSQNVLIAALDAGVKHVVGISTDKACHPTNTYGTSKMMMERIWQHYGQTYIDEDDPQFHLVRYGNVFGSTGSFVHNWLASLVENGYIVSTDPAMTRFWLTTDDALELIYHSLQEPSGCILVPRARSAKVGELEEWLIPDGIEVKYMGQRPGEKTHETLITEEEGYRTDQVIIDGEEFPRYFRIYPPTKREKIGKTPLRSNATHIRLNKEEFLKISGIEELNADDHS